MKTHDTTDVAIIGAGPSGAAAAAWLARRGINVRVIERQRFPRFSIGESLLPQCMVHLEACGLLDAVQTGDFQFKNGAAFTWRDRYAAIDFRDKFSPGLARPSTLESRCALFTHIEDRIDCSHYDRDKILIGLHPEHSGIWYWLIPFSQGRASVGVVGDRATLEAAGVDDNERLWHFLHAEPRLNKLLANAKAIRDIGRLEGYSADVEQLHGPGFALLGNAGEFLAKKSIGIASLNNHYAVASPPSASLSTLGTMVSCHALSLTINRYHAYAK